MFPVILCRLEMLRPLNVNRFVKFWGRRLSFRLPRFRLKTHFRALRVVNAASENHSGVAVLPRWHFAPEILHDRWLCLTLKLYNFNSNSAAAEEEVSVFLILCRGHIGAASVTVQPPRSRNSDSESGFPVWRNDLLIPSSRRTTHRRTNA